MIRTQYPVDAIGKRIRAGKDLTMYQGFPLSDKIKTLPAGKPSPIITGYIPRGYWQAAGEGDNPPFYIKDSEIIEVVPESAADNSGAVDSIISGVSDWVVNAAGQIKKQSGFLRDGFEKSVGDFNADLFNVAGGVKFALTITAVILGLIALIKFQK